MKRAVTFIFTLFLMVSRLVAQDFYIGLAGQDDGLKVWNARTGALCLEVSGCTQTISVSPDYRFWYLVKQE